MVGQVPTRVVPATESRAGWTIRLATRICQWIRASFLRSPDGCFERTVAYGQTGVGNSKVPAGSAFVPWDRGPGRAKHRGIAFRRVLLSSIRCACEVERDERTRIDEHWRALSIVPILPIRAGSALDSSVLWIGATRRITAESVPICECVSNARHLTQGCALEAGVMSRRPLALHGSWRLGNSEL